MRSSLTQLRSFGKRLSRAVSVLLLIAGSALYAQELTGRIYGTVRDNAGGITPGVTVVVTHVPTGTRRQLVTNDAGIYNGSKLEPGQYIVEAELTGFKKFRRSEIVLATGDVLEINIVMEVGQISDIVTVTERSPLVNTTTGANKTTLETELMEHFPIPNRGVVDLMQMVPGARKSAFHGHYAVGGLDGRRSSYALDGTDTGDPSGAYTVRPPDQDYTAAPPPDALSEFSVETNYSAEYGETPAAKILMTTRSGTNQYHGSIYDWFRTENLNANTFQNNYYGRPKQDFKKHQLGFTAGGPVSLPKIYNGKDKTFFFVNYQRFLDYPGNPITRQVGGLTAAELAGDFSQSTVKPLVSRSAATAPNSPFAGMENQEITNLTPFLSPTAVRMYRTLQIPLVATSGARYLEQIYQQRKIHDWTMRVDQTIGQKHNLSFSSFYQHNIPSPIPYDFAAPVLKSAKPWRTQHYSLSEIWTISPTMVNELRVGYIRWREYELLDNGGIDLNNLGIPYPTDSLNYTISTTASFFTIRHRTGLQRLRDTYNYLDTFSITKGSHFLKVGANIAVRNYITENMNAPSYSATGTWLRNPAAEFLIGWPTGGTISQGIYQPQRGYFNHFFVQDDWKASRRLSLNLGLRWEPYQWAYFSNDYALMFKPDAHSRYTNFPLGVITAGDPGWKGRAGIPNDYNNLAPRLGFAYRLDEKGTRVLRGSWGVFYNVAPFANEGFFIAGSTFPFFHNYTTSYDRGFPTRDSFSDVPAYLGLGHPDISTPLDVSTAVFDPQGTYGGNGGLMDHTVGWVQQWNFRYEQEFRPGWMLGFTYQGHDGRGLGANDFWNLPDHRDSNDSFNAENMASRRPLQDYRYQTRSYWTRRGDSRYHSGTVNLKVRTSNFLLMSWYALSHTRANIDNSTQSGTIGHPGPFDERDWGPPSFHRTHNFFMSPSYDLPSYRNGHGALGKLLGDWNATFIVSLQSGAPVDLRTQNNSYQCQACTVRPNLTGQPLKFENWKDDPRLVYVNPAGFTLPANGTYGDQTSRTNPLRWPASGRVDMSLSKQIPLWAEGVALQFRLDVFNMFNSADWYATAGGIRADQPATHAMTNWWGVEYPEIGRNMVIGMKLKW